MLDPFVPVGGLPSPGEGLFSCAESPRSCRAAAETTGPRSNGPPLSIIDLTTGDQPIASEDERTRIVVDGEFYGYEAIQRELEASFLSLGNDLLSVGVAASGDQLRLGEPQKVFSIALNDVARDTFSPYDVAPGGQRFLVNLPARAAPLFFVQGLDARLGKP